MIMYDPQETEAAANIAAMSEHHGSYTDLCECGGQPFLAHSVIGHQLYHYSETPDDTA